MNIKIGEKIKSLRKKTDVTQDKFAEYLGITPQAISRWENGTAYPDIEMIPAIANFFDISTDELFGLDKNKNQEKINKIYEQLNELSPKGLHNKKIEILRTAIQEFPNNHDLLKSLAGALSDKAHSIDDSEERKKYQDEAIAILERIAEDTDDEHLKYMILQGLAYEYSAAGNKEKAAQTANKLPNIHLTSSIILSRVLEGEARFRQIKSNISEFTDCLNMEYGMLARSKYNGQPEKQILLFKKAVAAFDILCENKDYGFYNERLSSLYISLCDAYLELNDSETALDCLNKVASYAVAFDEPETFETNKSFEHTSLVFEKEPGDNTTRVYSRTANYNKCYETLEKLKHEKYNAIRSNVKFTEISKLLEARAKKYDQ